MPQVQLQRFEQIVARMTGRMVARTDLSDISDSAVLKHLVAAYAREVDEVYYQLFLVTQLFDIEKASGDDLDERAKEIQPGSLTRISATKALGTVVFGRTGTVGDVTIPAGTVVKTEDGVVFRTAIQTQILNGGTTSPQTSTVADVAGAAGNVVAGAINSFGAKIAGVDTVTNTITFTGGRDKESDVSFRSRIKAFVVSLSRCTPDAIEFGVLGIEDSSGKQVLFSHVAKHPINPAQFTVYIDDGAGTAEATLTAPAENLTAGLTGPPADTAIGGEEYLQTDFWPIKTESGFSLTSTVRGALTQGTEYWLNPANGLVYFDPPLVTGEQINAAAYTYFDGLIAEVQKAVDGDPNDRENYPGYRAAGVLARVLSPRVQPISIEAVLTMQQGYELDEAVTAAEAAVTDYINNLGISGDVIRTELIKRLKGVDGVYDVDLVVPTTNITILDDEIPRSLAANINIT